METPPRGGGFFRSTSPFYTWNGRFPSTWSTWFSESVIATFLIQLREFCHGRASFESIWHARVLSNQIMFLQTIFFPNGTVIAHIVNLAHVLCLHPIKDTHQKRSQKVVIKSSKGLFDCKMFFLETLVQCAFTDQMESWKKSQESKKIRLLKIPLPVVWSAQLKAHGNAYQLLNWKPVKRIFSK